MKKSFTSTIFFTLIAVFVLVLGTIFVPGIIESLQGIKFLILPASFFFLGVALIFSTIKEKMDGKQRKFLLLTGGSAVLFLISVVLHNLFYAIGELTAHVPLLPSLVGILEVVFFFIAIPVCPIAFLVGVIGTLFSFKKT